MFSRAFAVALDWLPGQATRLSFPLEMLPRLGVAVCVRRSPARRAERVLLRVTRPSLEWRELHMDHSVGCNEILHDLTTHISQTIVATLKSISKPAVVDAELV